MPVRKGDYLLLTDEIADMDINLVDNMEQARPAEEGAASAPPGESSANNHQKGAPPTSGPRSPSETQNTIMMYSNEEEEGGFHMGFKRQQSWTSHYATMERDESIKCVVTSLLICAIVVAILVVIFVRNPEM